MRLPTSYRSLFFVLAVTLLLPWTGGCAQEPESQPMAAQEGPAVEYEAAYPEEVSEQGPTTADAAQQEAGHVHDDTMGDHSHGGDEAGHEHDDDGHPH